MGYTIEYAHTSIKTPMGYTVLWLAGSNNVTKPHWTGRGYTERRCRNWDLFGPDAAISADALIRFGESMTGGEFQEHWMSKGKWVDDAAMMRWIRNRIKEAVSLEELLKANNLTHIQCRLNIWGDQGEFSNRADLEASVSTSEELDEWVKKANAAREELKRVHGKKVDVFLEIGYALPEKLAHPQKMEGDRFAVKHGKNYVTDISFSPETGHITRVSYHSDPARAAVFGKETVQRIMAEPIFRQSCGGYASRLHIVPEATLMRAIERDKDRSWVVAIDSGETTFVSASTKRPSRVLYRTGAAGFARRFTENEARSFAETNRTRYNKPEMHAVKYQPAV